MSDIQHEADAIAGRAWTETDAREIEAVIARLQERTGCIMARAHLVSAYGIAWAAADVTEFVHNGARYYSAVIAFSCPQHGTETETRLLVRGAGYTFTELPLSAWQMGHGA